MNRRVVVTGLGAITPIGNNVPEFWSAVKQQKVGIGEITHFDATDYKCHLAAEVKDFDAKEYMDFRSAKRMEAFCQFAVAAAGEALEDSGLSMEAEDAYRVGTSISSGVGSLQAIEREHSKLLEKGPGRVNPLFVPMMISNMAAGNVSIQFGLKGKSLNISTACASGTNAIGEAFRTIQYGDAEVMVAGGTESCDWCQMLFRMYTRWAESHGYTTETLDYLEGEEAGIKSVTIEIRGENAYGHLKSEHGVHRLVRISPFNAAGKRQTSFVSCDVMPDINQDIDIEINDDDLRIDTYRSSGAGGQHINKTSSAIRITHLPTGIVVQCQNERSQHQNKDKAMQMLKAKLYLLKEAENAENLSGIRGDVKDINFGSQIRSYVLQPYTMVKDNRTNKEVANAGSVLDGNIDPFINAYLTWISTGKTEE